MKAADLPVVLTLGCLATRSFMKKRLTHYAFLLGLVVLMNFFIPRLLPGSPVGALLGDDPGSISAAEKMEILKSYQLDLPLWQQFFIYLKALITFNWGYSFSRRMPIAALIAEAATWTLLLTLASLLLSSVAGTLLGAASALLRKNRHDLFLLFGVIFFGALPSFGVAIFLIALFGVKLKWFPLYGAYSMWENYSGLAAVLDVAWHMVLPVLTMSLASFAVFFSTSRFGVLDVLKQDYVRMAKMRGISKSRIYFFYILRNAMVPVFTVFMMNVGYVLSGSVLIEAVFSYPGLGLLMYEAVSARDYPLMQYAFLISSFMSIAALFLSDTFYAKINPLMEWSDEE